MLPVRPNRILNVQVTRPEQLSSVGLNPLPAGTFVATETHPAGVPLVSQSTVLVTMNAVPPPPPCEIVYDPPSEARLKSSEKMVVCERATKAERSNIIELVARAAAAVDKEVLCFIAGFTAGVRQRGVWHCGEVNPNPKRLQFRDTDFTHLTIRLHTCLSLE